MGRNIVYDNCELSGLKEWDTEDYYIWKEEEQKGTIGTELVIKHRKSDSAVSIT